MDSSTETGVRGKWKGELWLSVVHEILNMHGLSNANDDCIVWTNTKEIVACAHVILLQDCAVEAGKAAGEILTCDLFESKLVLCVIGGDSTEYLWGVLYYVLLHVLNHYNIQIVWGFQLYAFPGLRSVLMCTCDWCFIVFNATKLMINVEEIMYHACIPQ